MSEKNLRGALVKFGKYEHVQSLYSKGELYLNTVSFFKNLDDEKLRGDRDENITQSLQSSKTKVGISTPGMPDMVLNTVGPIKFYLPHQDKRQFTHIFSMSIFCAGDKIEDDKIFDDRVKKFGDEAIIIWNTKELFCRLTKFFEKLLDEGSLFSFEGDFVKYFDFNSHHGELDIFSKSQEYSWQKEWRLGVRFLNHPDPFLLKIGSLKDIAVIAKTEDFFNGNIKFL
jgi:hypothetical protein